MLARPLLSVELHLEIDGAGAVACLRLGHTPGKLWETDQPGNLCHLNLPSLLCFWIKQISMYSSQGESRLPTALLLVLLSLPTSQGKQGSLR